MNIAVELINGAVITFVGEEYQYLNWMDVDDCFVIALQSHGKKEIFKFPRTSVLYIRTENESEVFDAFVEALCDETIKG